MIKSSNGTHPYHDPGFYKKLGIRPGHTLLLSNAPPDFVDVLLPNLPERVGVQSELDAGQRADIIILWPSPEEALPTLFAILRWSIKPDGAVWAVIPKKRFARKMGIDLTFDGMQNAALPTGLVDNKTLTFSEEYYGIRYVVRIVERDRTPEGREYKLTL
ncbi:MAG: hypothetical protein EXR50_08105 [Dehalococcoidia bacterium]|nr:hypothetical protein [Dehalococcoidia bacterium]